MGDMEGKSSSRRFFTDSICAFSICTLNTEVEQYRIEVLNKNLQGRVRFPTGGYSPRAARHDSV